tara:strand:+ start:1177 stop:1296 length:120 start_codon:yes stop_codon:yes gene_type:complete
MKNKITDYEDIMKEIRKEEIEKHIKELMIVKQFLKQLIK